MAKIESNGTTSVKIYGSDYTGYVYTVTVDVADGTMEVYNITVIYFFETIFSNNNGKYGDRLDGIEKVNVKAKQKNEIKKNIESLEMSTSVNVYLI